MDKFLAWIERVGNKLPHPFWLFVYLAAVIILASLICGLANVSVTHPVSGETVVAQSLFSQYGLQRFVLEMVTNFSHFAPLGLVLVMLMGVSLSVNSGLMETMLGRVTQVPDFMVIPVIVVAGIMGNLASDAGIVVVPPLAALAFKKTGRNPMAGVILAYAACTAGFTATLIPRGTDVLLAGFTNAALEDPNLHVGASSNLYFMIASVFMLALVMTWVAKRFTLPACNTVEQMDVEVQDEETPAGQRKGLIWSGIAVTLYTILALLTVLPEKGILRYDTQKIQSVTMKNVESNSKLHFVKGTTVLNSSGDTEEYVVMVQGQEIVLNTIDDVEWKADDPVRLYLPKGENVVRADNVVRMEIMPSVMRGPFFKGMVVILFFWFAIPGAIYGIFVGKVKKLADIPAMMTKSVKGVSGLLVLILVMSQFVAFFQWSNLDRIVAISGANLLNTMQVQGPLLLISTMLIVMVLNLFLGSSSAKWGVLAPILVPMFLYLENPISPAVSQLVYRLGDSTTNGISPLYPYFPLALGWLREYRKDAGIGTLIRLLLPYAVFTGLAWIVLLLIWYFLGIPVGPAEAIR
ncbi:AbgT family transporter [bacterium]|nr:AbgT family transporter [bacterium]